MYLVLFFVVSSIVVVRRTREVHHMAPLAVVAANLKVIRITDYSFQKINKASRKTSNHEYPQGPCLSVLLCSACARDIMNRKAI